MNPVAPPDRMPRLHELVRAEDVTAGLRHFLHASRDGAWIFDADGLPYAGAAWPSSPLARWDQLPPAGPFAFEDARSRFIADDHVFDLRPLHAGADRVGVLVVSRLFDGETADDPIVEGMSGLLGRWVQAGYAAWVTSELHRVAMENTHRALTQRNDELERAISHLRELDVLKSNFLATISHELRTPLTSVIGFADMLLDDLAGPLGAEQRDFIGTIRQRGEELLRLISQILEMSQLEVGGVRLELATHDPRAAVARALTSVASAAARAGVVLVPALDRAAPVIADAEALQRILVHLLNNAIAFAPARTQVVVETAPAPIRRPYTEETRFGEEASDAIRVSVHDSGIGIPADHLQRVFEAFHQVDASPTREHGGAGLGLAIVRRLVEAHGGEVWAESRPGQGTSIHFTLPRASQAAIGADPARGQIDPDPAR